MWKTATSAVNTAVDEFNTLRATAENIAGAHGIVLPQSLLNAQAAVAAMRASGGGGASAYGEAYGGGGPGGLSHARLAGV
jgi:hypothetical protein